MPQTVILSLSCRVGAKSKPDRAAISKILARALKEVPGEYCPDTLGEKRIAIDVMVVSDDEIAELNVAHLKHAGPTDVLSFPMGEIDPERGAFHLGEIVVSFETAEREAAARAISFDEELTRYIVHGFLHLLGYDDSTTAQRKEMHAMQERILKSAKFTC